MSFPLSDAILFASDEDEREDEREDDQLAAAQPNLATAMGRSGPPHAQQQRYAPQQEAAIGGGVTDLRDRLQEVMQAIDATLSEHHSTRASAAAAAAIPPTYRLGEGTATGPRREAGNIVDSILNSASPDPWTTSSDTLYSSAAAAAATAAAESFPSLPRNDALDELARRRVALADLSSSVSELSKLPPPPPLRPAGEGAAEAQRREADRQRGRSPHFPYSSSPLFLGVDHEARAADRARREAVRPLFDPSPTAQDRQHRSEPFAAVLSDHNEDINDSRGRGPNHPHRRHELDSGFDPRDRYLSQQRPPHPAGGGVEGLISSPSRLDAEVARRRARMAQEEEDSERLLAILCQRSREDIEAMLAKRTVDIGPLAIEAARSAGRGVTHKARQEGRDGAVAGETLSDAVSGDFPHEPRAGTSPMMKRQHAQRGWVTRARNDDQVDGPPQQQQQRPRRPAPRLELTTRHRGSAEEEPGPAAAPSSPLSSSSASSGSPHKGGTAEDEEEEVGAHPVPKALSRAIATELKKLGLGPHVTRVPPERAGRSAEDSDDGDLAIPNPDPSTLSPNKARGGYDGERAEGTQRHLGRPSCMKGEEEREGDPSLGAAASVDDVTPFPSVSMPTLHSLPSREGTPEQQRYTVSSPDSDKGDGGSYDRDAEGFHPLHNPEGTQRPESEGEASPLGNRSAHTATPSPTPEEEGDGTMAPMGDATVMGDGRSRLEEHVSSTKSQRSARRQADEEEEIPVDVGDGVGHDANYSSHHHQQYDHAEAQKGSHDPRRAAAKPAVALPRVRPQTGTGTGTGTGEESPSPLTARDPEYDILPSPVDSDRGTPPPCMSPERLASIQSERLHVSPTRLKSMAAAEKKQHSAPRTALDEWRRKLAALSAGNPPGSSSPSSSSSSSSSSSGANEAAEGAAAATTELEEELRDVFHSNRDTLFAWRQSRKRSDGVGRSPDTTDLHTPRRKLRTESVPRERRAHWLPGSGKHRHRGGEDPHSSDDMSPTRAVRQARAETTMVRALHLLQQRGVPVDIRLRGQKIPSHVRLSEDGKELLFLVERVQRDGAVTAAARKRASPQGRQLAQAPAVGGRREVSLYNSGVFVKQAQSPSRAAAATAAVVPPPSRSFTQNIIHRRTLSAPLSQSTRLAPTDVPPVSHHLSSSVGSSLGNTRTPARTPPRSLRAGRQSSSAFGWEGSSRADSLATSVSGRFVPIKAGHGDQRVLWLDLNHPRFSGGAVPPGRTMPPPPPTRPVSPSTSLNTTARPMSSPPRNAPALAAHPTAMQRPRGPLTAMHMMRSPPRAHQAAQVRPSNSFYLREQDHYPRDFTPPRPMLAKRPPGAAVGRMPLPGPPPPPSRPQYAAPGGPPMPGGSAVAHGPNATASRMASRARALSPQSSPAVGRPASPAQQHQQQQQQQQRLNCPPPPPMAASVYPGRTVPQRTPSAPPAFLRRPSTLAARISPGTASPAPPLSSSPQSVVLLRRQPPHHPQGSMNPPFTNAPPAMRGPSAAALAASTVDHARHTPRPGSTVVGIAANGKPVPLVPLSAWSGATAAAAAVPTTHPTPPNPLGRAKELHHFPLHHARMYFPRGVMGYEERAEADCGPGSWEDVAGVLCGPAAFEVLRRHRCPLFASITGPSYHPYRLYYIIPEYKRLDSPEDAVLLVLDFRTRKDFITFLIAVQGAGPGEVLSYGRVLWMLAAQRIQRARAFAGLNPFAMAEQFTVSADGIGGGGAGGASKGKRVAGGGEKGRGSSATSSAAAKSRSLSRTPPPLRAVSAERSRRKQLRDIFLPFHRRHRPSGGDSTTSSSEDEEEGQLTSGDAIASYQRPRAARRRRRGDKASDAGRPSRPQPSRRRSVQKPPVHVLHSPTSSSSSHWRHPSPARARGGGGGGPLTADPEQYQMPAALHTPGSRTPATSPPSAAPSLPQVRRQRRSSGGDLLVEVDSGSNASEHGDLSLLSSTLLHSGHHGSSHTMAKPPLSPARPRQPVRDWDEHEVAEAPPGGGNTRKDSSRFGVWTKITHHRRTSPRATGSNGGDKREGEEEGPGAEKQSKRDRFRLPFFSPPKRSPAPT